MRTPRSAQSCSASTNAGRGTKYAAVRSSDRFAAAIAENFAWRDIGRVPIGPYLGSRQAAAAGHAPADELLLLTTHGILHLLGHDHAEVDEEREMFDLQRRLLLTFLAGRGRSANPPAGRS